MGYKHVAIVKGRAESVVTVSLTEARKKVIQWVKFHCNTYKWKNNDDWESIWEADKDPYRMKEVGRISWGLRDGKFRFKWETRDSQDRLVTYDVYSDGRLKPNSKRTYPSLKKLVKKKRTANGKYIG